MLDEAVNHVSQTWDHVLHGKSTVAEKAEVVAEGAAGLAVLAGLGVAGRFALTRMFAPGAASGSEGAVLPELTLTQRSILPVSDKVNLIAEPTEAAGRGLFTLEHAESGAQVTFQGKNLELWRGAVDIQGNAWKANWDGIKFLGVERRAAGSSEWVSGQFDGRVGFSGPDGMTDGFGELVETSGSGRTMYRALDGQQYSEYGPVVSAYERLFGNSREIVRKQLSALTA